jgi:hypothetical protein
MGEISVSIGDGVLRGSSPDRCFPGGRVVNIVEDKAKTAGSIAGATELLWKGVRNLPHAFSKTWHERLVVEALSGKRTTPCKKIGARGTAQRVVHVVTVEAHPLRCKRVLVGCHCRAAIAPMLWRQVVTDDKQD